MRFEDFPEHVQQGLLALECPTFETTPWAEGPALQERSIAIVTTAGLMHRDDRPFTHGSSEYRTISADVEAGELVMGHVSTNFDRSAFEEDWNVVFPLDRLKELAAEGTIGAVAPRHYSFMGATDPIEMRDGAREIAKSLKKDGVTAVLLTPV